MRYMMLSPHFDRIRKDFLKSLEPGVALYPHRFSYADKLGC